jgi:hypothetical protein
MSRFLPGQAMDISAPLYCISITATLDTLPQTALNKQQQYIKV